ncbi:MULTISPECIES: hypothetical protein [Aerosakkonema]|uniref:hypothetical protein n=1 Tax=Aerosakkonema TaxID=1246629 RepID=UPI0035B74EA1
MNAKLIAIATSSTLMIANTSTALAEQPYKTSGNQVVVTQLQPRQTYLVQTTDTSGKEGSMYVTTNECGYVMINNGGNYQRLTINNETIRPFALATQPYPSCNPRLNPRNSNTQQSSDR